MLIRLNFLGLQETIVEVGRTKLRILLEDGQTSSDVVHRN